MSKLAELLSRHPKQHVHSSYLTLIKGSLGILIDPDNTETVFDIEDGLRRSTSTNELLQFTTQDPLGKAPDARTLSPTSTQHG